MPPLSCDPLFRPPLILEIGSLVLPRVVSGDHRALFRSVAHAVDLIRGHQRVDWDSVEFIHAGAGAPQWLLGHIPIVPDAVLRVELRGLDQGQGLHSAVSAACSGIGDRRRGLSRDGGMALAVPCVDALPEMIGDANSAEGRKFSFIWNRLPSKVTICSFNE